MKQIEFLFDYGSPFSYLASVQMPALAQRTGAEVVYCPVLLGGILKATGNVSPMTIPAKAKYWRWSCAAPPRIAEFPSNRILIHSCRIRSG